MENTTILRKKNDEESRKVDKNTKTEEKNMEKNEKEAKNVIINDVTPKTREKLDKSKAKAAKKEAKSTKKPKTSTKKAKGGDIVDHKTELIRVLEKAAKKYNLGISRLTNRAGLVSSVRLQRGNDNVVTVRSTDVVIHKPKSMFAKKVLDASPVFRLFNKSGEQTYAHMTHLRLKVSVENLGRLVAKACGDKKATSDWKSNLNAIGRSVSTKVADPVQELKALKEKEATLKKEIATAKRVKAQVKKSTAKKSTKAKGVIAKVAKATS